MSLRPVILAIVLAFAPCGLANAQDTETPTHAQEAISESEVALRDLYQALFFDTGIFDTIAQQMYPTYRQHAMASEYYQSSRGSRREALDRVIDATPDIMREEVIAESNVMAGNINERASALLPPEEIRALAAMMRDPELRPLMQRLALRGAQDENDDATPEEQAQLEAYAAANLSPALLERGPALMDLVRPGAERRQSKDSGALAGSSVGRDLHGSRLPVPA